MLWWPGPGRANSGPRRCGDTGTLPLAALPGPVLGPAGQKVHLDSAQRTMQKAIPSIDGTTMPRCEVNPTQQGSIQELTQAKTIQAAGAAVGLDLLQLRQEALLGVGQRLAAGSRERHTLGIDTIVCAGDTHLCSFCKESYLTGSRHGRALPAHAYAGARQARYCWGVICCVAKIWMVVIGSRP